VGLLVEPLRDGVGDETRPDRRPGSLRTEVGWRRAGVERVGRFSVWEPDRPMVPDEDDPRFPTEGAERRSLRLGFWGRLVPREALPVSRGLGCGRAFGVWGFGVVAFVGRLVRVGVGRDGWVVLGCSRVSRGLDILR
jgi:hypothetical protein